MRIFIILVMVFCSVLLAQQRRLVNKNRPALEEQQTKNQKKDTTLSSEFGVTELLSFKDAKFQEVIKKSTFQITSGGDEDSWKDGDEQISIVSKGVHMRMIHQKRLVLEVRCDQAVIWYQSNSPKTNEDEKAKKSAQKTKKSAKKTQKTKDEKSVKKEELLVKFYAEGNVHFRKGKEILQGDRLYFDQQASRGVILNGTLRGSLDSKSRKTPLFLKAKEIRILSQDKIKAKDAIISTCQFGEPHYHFHTDEAEVTDNEQGSFIQARENSLYAGRTPIFYIPYVAAETEYNWPLKSARYGNSSRFGNHLLTTWGGNIYKGTGESFVKKIDWSLDLDVREDRGLAIGPGVIYEGDAYFGEILGYYAHDQPLSDLGDSLDDGVAEVNEASFERLARIYGLHRHIFQNGVSVDVEVSQFSDEVLLFDFFENEARQEKEPETYINARKIWHYQAVTAFASRNLNDFINQITFLPKLNHRVIQLPFGHNRWGSFYYTSNFEVSNVFREDDQDNPSEFDGEHIWRVDWENRLSHKFTFGHINVLPFVVGRLTHFEKDIDGDYQTFRGTAQAGITTSTNFYRAYGVSSGLFDVNRLLHVITPEISYLWQETSVQSEELIPFDEVEDIDDLQEVRVRLINRLKTLRGGVANDFLILDVAQSYFPDQGGDFREKLSNLEVDLIWQVRQDLSLIAEAEYNHNNSNFDDVTIRMRWNPAPAFFASFDLRYNDNDRFITTLVGDYIFSQKWSFAFRSQYDFEESAFRENSVTVRRAFHRFLLDMEFVVDEIDDNQAFNIAVTPLDFVSTRTFRNYTDDNSIDSDSRKFFNQGY